MKGTAYAVAALLAAALASSPAIPATPISPKLAPGVKPQAGYEQMTDRLVVANPTPIYSDIVWTSPQPGQFDKVGEPVTALAKVKDWDWVLVGRDGLGVGYVSLDLLTHADSKSPAGR